MIRLTVPDPPVRAMAEHPLYHRVREAVEASAEGRRPFGIIAGLSGGADSICLASLLSRLREPLGIKVQVVHVNHLLRGNESDGDEGFVLDFCKKADLPCRIFRADVGKLSAEKGLSEEEVGRLVRYAFLKQAMEEAGYQVIAVAHNREDRAETVFMNLMRGAGLEGLAAFSLGNEVKPGDKPRELLRPLLDAGRDEILAYLKSQGLSYRVDSSNLSDDYQRNRVRNQVFPFIRKQMGLDPVKPLISLSKRAYEENQFLEELAGELLDRVLLDSGGNYLVVDAKGLAAAKPVLSRRAVRLIWSRLNGSKKNLESVHVEDILALCGKNITGKYLMLPETVTVKTDYGRLEFLKGDRTDVFKGKKDLTDFCRPAAIPGITPVPEVFGCLKAELLCREEAQNLFGSLKSMPEESMIQLFDYGAFEGGIDIRCRRNGDRIRPKGGPGEQKLKELFINKKIPFEKRGQIPLLAKDNRIIWAIGVRTSEACKISSLTRQIAVLTWIDNT